MSEFKPKKDDNLAGADRPKAAKPESSGDSPKRQGDKLKHAVDEAATEPRGRGKA